MPNPGSFQGARKVFIESVKGEYAQAAKDGDVKEIRQDIFQRYYLCFPVSKGDAYEPTQAELEAVNNKAPPRREENPEGWEGMSTEERSAVMKERGEFVRAKNAVSAQLVQLHKRQLKHLFFHSAVLSLANCPTPEIRVRP